MTTKRARGITIIAAGATLVFSTAPEVSYAESWPDATIAVWDTGTPLAGTEFVDTAGRDRWRSVPAIESDGYAPAGDLMIETDHLVAHVPSRGDRVRVRPAGVATGAGTLGLSPLPEAEATACRLVARGPDRAVVQVTYARKGRAAGTVLFVFTGDGRVEVQPSETVAQMAVHAAVRYGVVPDLIAGDQLFDPVDSTQTEPLLMPAGHLLLGLLRGGDAMVVLTLPVATQRVRLVPADDRDEATYDRIEVADDERGFHLSLLSAPGIWHEEQLSPAYLERDVVSEWRRPFEARWRTQLLEDDVPTTYRFQRKRLRRYWRGGVGTYTYPVWFDGDRTTYRLGKKVPPVGTSVVYFVERSDDSPDAVTSPLDVVRQTLGDEVHHYVAAPEGRTPTSDARSGKCVGVATCGVTSKLKPIFEAGEQTERREYVEGGAQDMVYHLTTLLGRAHRYRDFAEEMLETLSHADAEAAAPAPFLAEMEAIVEELVSTHERRRENTGDRERANQLAASTVALTSKSGPDVLPAYLGLGEQWRAMGGALETLIREQHTTARKLFLAAGRGAMRLEAAAVAARIRTRTRELLMNPNQYEWTIEPIVNP